MCVSVPQFAKIVTLSFYPTLKIGKKISFPFSAERVAAHEMNALLHVAVKISNALCIHIYSGREYLCRLNEMVLDAHRTYGVQ